jgi:WbqC-like protein family
LRLVISQPMLMPWAGLFEQLRLCDKFIFFDDVQLPLGGGRGRGFITRVQIKTARGVEWLSLPMARAEQGKQLIMHARFAHQRWRQEHIEKITQAYKSARYFAEVLESVVQPIYAFDTDHLSEFCMHSIRVLARAIGVERESLLSSQLGVPRNMGASERVLEECRRLGATDYISGLGAMNYIDYELFERAAVRIHFMRYDLRPYAQLHGAFSPYVSAIDLLFNLGQRASEHLSSPCLYWRDWAYFDASGRPVSRPG